MTGRRRTTERFAPEQACLEFAESVELSPAQATWIEPMRAAHAHDARRRLGCDGCEWFGLCALHAAERVA